MEQPNRTSSGRRQRPANVIADASRRTGDGAATRRRRRHGRSSTCRTSSSTTARSGPSRDVYAADPRRTRSPRSSARRAAASPPCCARFNRMNDLIAGARVEGEVRYRGVDLYGRERLADRGAPPHRHGLPEAEPVPQVHLRQRRLRPAHQRHRQQGRARRDRRAVAAQRRAVGRGQGPAEASPASACPAASSSGCASPARIAVEPDVVLMDEPCSALDPIATGSHRGPDARAQVAVHDRHRHAQHAAGDPGQRPHRVLLRARRDAEERHPHRRARRVRPDRSRSSRTRTTSAPRPTSPAAWGSRRAR